MNRPSDHLLRTLATVPPSRNILEVGCGDGQHTASLLRLGFSVHACAVDIASVAATRERITELVGEDMASTCVQQVAPDGFGAYPSDAFHWIIAHTPSGYIDSPDQMTVGLRRLRRLLIPGGWLYLALAVHHPASNGAPSGGVTPDGMTACAREAGLAPAESAAQADDEEVPLVRGIFRLAPDVTSP